MPVLPNSALPGAINTGSIGSAIGSAVSTSLLGAVGMNSANGRVNVADMFQYGTNSTANGRINGPAFQVIYPAANQDWRVRISLAPNSNYFYNDPNNKLLSPLTSIPGLSAASGLRQLTGIGGANRVGVVFPYTPQLQVTHKANYTGQEVTHSNYKNYFYNYSEVEAISINADFTVQSVDEGQYLLATIYFFRSLTKMFFGQDPQAGNPPPVVYLNGYGQYYLPNVPCVVTSFQHTMPQDVDYMDIPEPLVTTGAYYNPQVTSPRLNSTRLPTTSTIILTVQPVYSRVSQTLGYSLNDFANGALLAQPNSSNPATAFGASTNPQNSKFKPFGGFL